MNGFAAGRIAGVPIYFNETFVFLVVLYASGYLRMGTPKDIIVGVFAVVGGVASILLHELAHASAARACGVRPLYIELHGLGGACHFARSPHKRAQRLFVTLAGPAANFALWALFYWLGKGANALIDFPDDGEVVMSGMSRLEMSLETAFFSLASLNFGMGVFNLLPSFPLDGGRALAEVLAGRFDLAIATQVVGTLGFGVCAYCVYLAFTSQGLWMLVLAYSLFIANQQALDTLGVRKWQRWDKG